MYRATYLLLLLFLLIFNKTFSQDSLQLTQKDSIITRSYIVGLGYNFVDDSGSQLRNFSKIDETINAVAFPSRISFGRYFKSGVGIEAIGTYNEYRKGKIIDGFSNTEVTDYYALDTRISYDLNKLIGQTAWFDPYVGLGIGYSNANNIARITYNSAIGFRTWFSEHWGLDLNATGKWTMGDMEASNHLQYGAGVVYQFGIEKELTNKGEKKLAILLDQERSRQQDSIQNANRLTEEALFVERQNKEKARLAALEAEKESLINKRKAQIETSIAQLGNAYFDLNSSYLNEDAKPVLDGLVTILEKEPAVMLKVSSHTDSRGTSAYNDWLSARRVKRTIDYLVANGIAKERLTAESYGEALLMNDCNNNVYCPEEKHRINRRSEFTVTKF